MTAAQISAIGAQAAQLAAMPTRTVEQEREQTLALCAMVRILADACSGECSRLIDCASDIEAQIYAERTDEALVNADLQMWINDMRRKYA